MPRRRSGDRARDRAERRRRRIEQAELRLGPPRGGRSGARGGRRRRRKRSSPNRSACRATLDEMIARRVEVPHRLPGRRLRQALRRLRRQRAQGRRRAAAGRDGSSPRRSRATTSSCWRTRTSTRSRGCTPRPTSCSASPAQFEGDYKLKFHLAPPLFEQARPTTGEPRKRRTARGC